MQTYLKSFAIYIQCIPTIVETLYLWCKAPTFNNMAVFPSAITDICSTPEQQDCFVSFFNTATITHFKASNTSHAARGNEAALRHIWSPSFLYLLHMTQ